MNDGLLIFKVDVQQGGSMILSIERLFLARFGKFEFLLVINHVTPNLGSLKITN
jgi:hypothetical protein